MTDTGIVTESCGPYPQPRNHLLDADQPRDYRHSQWLTEAIDRLDEYELRLVLRTFALLMPRAFEQELAMTSYARNYRASLRVTRRGLQSISGQGGSYAGSGCDSSGMAAAAGSGRADDPGPAPGPDTDG